MSSRRLLAILVLAFAFCLPAVAMAASQVTITHLLYTSSGQKYHDYFYAMEKAFEAKNPHINIDFIVGDGPKFDTMRLAGVAPDIIDIPDYAHLGPLGELVDLMPLMQRDGSLKKLNPAVVKSLTTPNGAVYNVPLQLAINTAYFNRDLFQQGGLTAPDKLGNQWNWDAVYQSAKKLTKDVNGDGVPETFGLDRPWGATWRVLVFQAGGSFYEWDKNLQPVRSLWTSEPVVSAFEYVARFCNERLTAYNFPGVTESQFYYWTGKSAIDLNDGVGIIGSYLKDASFDWDISLMPAGKAGPVTMFNGAGPHVVASTQNLDAVWEWIKFFAFDEANITTLVQTNGVIPALQGAMQSFPEVAGLRNKNYQALFAQTQYPQPYTQWPVPLDINPRKIDVSPILKGTTAVRTHLQTIHEKTQAFIDQMRAAKK